MRRPLVIMLFLLTIAPLTTGQTFPVSPKKSIADSTTESVTPDTSAQLIAAIKGSELSTVLKLLQAGVDPNTDYDGDSALCSAVRSNSRPIVEALLEHKADVNQEDDGGSPLAVAAVGGNAEMVKLLLARGADPRKVDDDGHSALFVAAFGVVFKSAPDWLRKSFLSGDDEDQVVAMIGNEHMAIVSLLVAAGADTNSQGGDCGLTPLMIAAIGGNVELTRILLAHHADPNLKNDEMSALKFAEADSAATLKDQLAGIESDDSKQAYLNWLHFTRPGRQQIAKMLRAAGAR